MDTSVLSTIVLCSNEMIVFDNAINVANAGATRALRGRFHSLIGSHA
jgi:hypothetical protein